MYTLVIQDEDTSPSNYAYLSKEEDVYPYN